MNVGRLQLGVKESSGELTDLRSSRGFFYGGSIRNAYQSRNVIKDRKSPLYVKSRSRKMLSRQHLILQTLWPSSVIGMAATTLCKNKQISNTSAQWLRKHLRCEPPLSERLSPNQSRFDSYLGLLQTLCGGQHRGFATAPLQKTAPKADTCKAFRDSNPAPTHLLQTTIQLFIQLLLRYDTQTFYRLLFKGKKGLSYRQRFVPRGCLNADV